MTDKEETNSAPGEPIRDEPPNDALPSDEVQILDVSAENENEIVDTEEPLADEAAALEIATRQPPIAPLLMELGIDVDDLAVAELAATGGPVYDLTEFDDVEEVGRLLDLLDTMSARWALDRSGQLIVHYNDETAVDEMIERVFDDPFADDADVHSVQPQEAEGEPNELAFNFADGNITIDVSEPAVPSTGNGASLHYGVSDAEGRPAIDDLTANPSPIVTGRTPIWVAALGLVALFAALVALFIVFIV